MVTEKLVESRESQINVEELMLEIRRAVTQRQTEGRNAFGVAAAELFELLAKNPPASLAAALARMPSEIAPLRLQPEFVPHPDDHYHVNDLLKYHDKEFIWNGYRAILKREPDSEGFESYLAKLREGRFNKIDVLGSISRSPEGRRNKVTIEELAAPAAFRRIYRLPIIGYVFELLVEIARLPALIRNQRVVEGHLWAQQELIAEEINKTNAQIGNTATLNELYDEQRALARALHAEMVALTREHQEAATISSASQHANLDDLLALFADQFRGSPEEVRVSLRAYLPLLEESGISSDILDLGCGRGEWLEVLKEAGLHGRGVDSNHALVHRCEIRGLDVSESEALRYLVDLPDNCLSAVTAFHFVEHLKLDQLVCLLDQVQRTLRPGGLVILETPNPKNLVVGACNFYSDPTHQHPLFPETLKFILEQRRFAPVRLEYLHPVPDSPFTGDDGERALDSWFFTARDFAVIGWKP